jgi:CrcB protein
MRIPIAVALGGAFGALARYLMVGRIEHWLGAGFPFGTLAVNVLGSFLMGVLIELMALVCSRLACSAPSPAFQPFPSRP